MFRIQDDLNGSMHLSLYIKSYIIRLTELFLNYFSLFKLIYFIFLKIQY